MPSKRFLNVDSMQDYLIKTGCFDMKKIGELKNLRKAEANHEIFIDGHFSTTELIIESAK